MEPISLRQRLSLQSTNPSPDIGGFTPHDLRDLNPPGDGEVGSNPILDAGKGDLGIPRNRDRLPHRKRGSIHFWHEVPTGYSDDEITEHQEPKPDKGYLEAGLAFVIVDQTISHSQGSDVHCPRRGHSEPLISPTPQILDSGKRPTAEDFKGFHVPIGPCTLLR